jgi:hypothetical protein
MFHKTIHSNIEKELACSQFTKACLFLAGPDNMEHLKRIAEEMQKQVAAQGAIQAKEENDDDVPQLVPGETFEEVAA